MKKDVRFQELVELELELEGEAEGEGGHDREHLQPESSSGTISDSNTTSGSDGTPSTMLSIWQEAVILAVPLAVSRLSWVTMKTTDTALIGHTGTLNLSASAVADLYTQSTGVFINGWILSTLVSHAVGSTNKIMGGIWLQVSILVISCLAVPVMLSWLLCGPMLRLFGVSDDLIRPAAYSALILMTAIPARIGVGQLSQYLMAQGITNPLVKTGLFSMVLNLFLGITLVLGVGIPGWEGFGFWVCPVVTVVVEWITLIIYVYWFCHKKQLHRQEGCWPEDGFQWAYITKQRVKEYVNLYYPAALAGASDWWRVSAIGVVAVSFNDHASLAVFNSSYRIAWMSLIVVGSIGSAMGVLLGKQLGKGDFNMAKRITWNCLILACIVIVVLASVFYAIPGKVALIFSTDPEVVDLYEEVALPLTTMMISMNLSVLLERVPLSCGRTQVVLWTGVIGSWAAQVPAVLLCTAYYRNDLYGLYTGVTLGYCALDVLLVSVVYTTDWAFYAKEAKRRSEEVVKSDIDEEMVPSTITDDEELQLVDDDKDVATPKDYNDDILKNESDVKAYDKLNYHSTPSGYDSVVTDNRNTFDDDESESLW
jgi:MATE family multidrug resistance protein